MKKSEESLCELCDTLKCLKISIMGVLEGEEREKGAKRNTHKMTEDKKGSNQILRRELNPMKLQTFREYMELLENIIDSHYLP